MPLAFDEELYLKQQHQPSLQSSHIQLIGSRNWAEVSYQELCTAALPSLFRQAKARSSYYYLTYLEFFDVFVERDYVDMTTESPIFKKQCGESWCLFGFEVSSSLPSPPFPIFIFVFFASYCIFEGKTISVEVHDGKKVLKCI